MASPRLRSIQFALLLILGVFLAMENLSMLLHVFLHPELPHPSDNYAVIGIVSPILTALLILGLFFLSKGWCRERNLLLADKSRAIEDWQQTFNSMTDLVSVHDRNFRIVKANSALCEFLGKKSEEIIGRYCYQLFHDRDAPIDDCPHGKARDAGHAVTLAVNDPHLAVPLLITCSPFFDRDGCFAGSVHMARLEALRDSAPGDDPRHFIPICASCKDIRDQDGNWIKIDAYVTQHLNGRLTHSICKDCQKRIYPEFFRV